MASEAITRNDLTAILNAVLPTGGGGGGSPEPVTVSINSNVATGSLSAYKIGKLVVVSGMLHPIVTGVQLQVATLSGCTAIANNYIPVGGYAINTQELYLDANTNILGLNTTQANVDLKVNFSFVIQ